MEFNKVIIVDNDDLVDVHLDKILHQHHFQIDYVDNEIDAADKILLNDYDYYFISYYSHSDRLVQLIKDIKKKSKIIIMSEDESFESEEKIRSIGITYLLKKPFSEKEIHELIKH